MLSGGIESTYLLWSALVKSEHKIHAHFVWLVGSKHAKHQRHRVHKVVEYLERYRDFQYDESMFGCIYATANIMLDVANVGAYVCNGYSRLHDVPLNDITFARGFNKKDTSEPGNSIPISAGLFHNYFIPFNNDIDRLPVIDHRVTGNVTKSEMMKEMPNDLVELTVSCHNCTGDGACGKCSKCEEREDAKRID